MQIYWYGISFLLSFGACKNEPKQAQSYKNEKRNSNDSSKKLVNAEPNPSPNPNNKAIFSYNLKNPDATFELHEELWEVSGIEWTKENGILAVQDEGGFVYFLNEKTGTMQKELNFAPKGDYESVRLVNDVIWVLQADGFLHKIQNWKSDKPKRDIIKLPFNDNNDLEGLCYDKEKNRLLIACKNSPVFGEKIKDYRAIYAFDIENEEVSQEPIYTLTMEKVNNYLQKNPQSYQNAAVLERLKKAKAIPFMPSEVAINPKNGYTYVLAGTGFAIFVFNQDNELLHIAELDEDIFVQAEGLTFADNGDMFISSEGRFNGNTAKIWRFNWQQ